MAVGNAGQQADSPKEFAPGVRIDWKLRLVEVDATVVLRKGVLELLACSPQTREHESILSVRARPLHIFQALGLIGLNPGSPVGYDRKADRLIAPSGAPLTIKVRYPIGGVDRVESVEHWLVDVKQNRPIGIVNWVFAGSQIVEGGRFAADLDGTIIAVVDFESALITVGEVRSSDNQHLWLGANTEAIPPVGTSCTLLIGRSAGPTLEVALAQDGTLIRSNKSISMPELVTIVQRGRTEGWRVRVIIVPLAGVKEKTIASTVDSLAESGLDRSWIETRHRAPTPQDVEKRGRDSSGGAILPPRHP